MSERTYRVSLLWLFLALAGSHALWGAVFGDAVRIIADRIYWSAWALITVWVAGREGS